MLALHRQALIALAIAIGSIAIAPAVRADILVDDFTQRNPLSWPVVQSASTGGGVATTETGLSGVAGTTRGFLVRNATIGVPGLDSMTATVFTTGVSVFDYQSSVGASSDVELFYGDEFLNPMHLGAATGISITFSAYDRVAAAPLEVDVALGQQTSPNTAVGNSQTLLMTTAGAQTIVLPNINPKLTNIDQIQIDFVAPAGTDFRVDSISLITTPEPASIGLIALAAPLLLKRRR